MNNFLAVCLCLVLGFCEHSTEPSNQKIDAEFELKYGESAQIVHKDVFTITYKDLLEDSRCPIGVECVWAGNAKVLLRVANADSAVNTTLQPKEVTYIGRQGIRYSITLRAVSPYPVNGVEMKKEQSRIRLLVRTNEVRQ